MNVKIAICNSRIEKKLKNIEMSWKGLTKRLEATTRTAETVEEYPKLKKGKQDAIKDVGGFVGGHLKEGRRKNGYVLERSLLTLDMDYGEPGIWNTIKALQTYMCCVYSTHKHTPEKPRLRLVIPLSRTISEDEYPAVARMVASDIGIDLFDDTTYEPTRLMYWPSTSSNGEFFFAEKDGDLLNPDEYLARYKDWRDVTTWPMSSRQSEVVRRAISKQADPLEKDGTIGAFCRTYSIEDAIGTFLTDVYEPSAMVGRYDYIPADSAAGVCTYDGKFAFSHHATDPACGRLLNAFDLVRIHKFGHLDLEAKEDTNTDRLPSYKAMVDFVINDDTVKTTIAEERRLAAQKDFNDEGIWEKNLELDKKGKVKDNISNMALIIEHDEGLQNIVFNRFKNCIDVLGDLPWREKGPGWTDSDLANAKLYIARKYDLWSPVKFKDALSATLPTKRAYHPVVDYLESLTWDKVPRIDNLLTDVLGAEDNVYVKAVSRKFLVAAVARVYDPGVKFDCILVLNGEQGLGKSAFYNRLAKGWFSDSLSIVDMKDKSAAEKLSGNWIVEIAELAGLKKMDMETVKAFITRTNDKYRPAYGAVVEDHPRTSIIVGTANGESGFLRDITGNRRFWPINCLRTKKFKNTDIDDYTLNQLWAEAKYYYEQGELLYLVGEAERLSFEYQCEALEHDPRQGLVEEYLEKLLPTTWGQMDIYQRRDFLNGGDFNSPGTKGTVKRTRVCTMEIWCECFGKPRESIRKCDSYEIEAILMRIKGWEPYSQNRSSKMRFSGGYGIQKAFVRVSKESNNVSDKD